VASSGTPAVADNRKYLKAVFTGVAPEKGKFSNRIFQKLKAGASAMETTLFDNQKVIAGAMKKRWNLCSIPAAFCEIKALSERVSAAWHAAIVEEEPNVRMIVEEFDWTVSWVQGSKQFNVNIGAVLSLINTLAATQRALPTMSAGDQRRIAIETQQECAAIATDATRKILADLLHGVKGPTFFGPLQRIPEEDLLHFQFRTMEPTYKLLGILNAITLPEGQVLTEGAFGEAGAFGRYKIDKSRQGANGIAFAIDIKVGATHNKVAANCHTISKLQLATCVERALCVEVVLSGPTLLKNIGTDQHAVETFGVEEVTLRAATVDIGIVTRICQALLFDQYLVKIPSATALCSVFPRRFAAGEPTHFGNTNSTEFTVGRVKRGNRHVSGIKNSRAVEILTKMCTAVTAEGKDPKIVGARIARVMKGRLKAKFRDARRAVYNL
jgi:hypothetical protein